MLKMYEVQVQEPQFCPLYLVARGQIFKCRSFDTCPGGPPGTCGGGLIGIPCAECPEGLVAPATSSGRPGLAMLYSC